MIFSRTILRVCDNSGAKYIKAISLWGDNYRSFGRLCDHMLVVPKKLRRKQKSRARALLQKRKKYIGLILSTIWNTRRRDGTFIKFLTRSAALLTLKGKFLGTALKLPVCKEFKQSPLAQVGEYKKILVKTRLYI